MSKEISMKRLVSLQDRMNNLRAQLKMLEKKKENLLRELREEFGVEDISEAEKLLQDYRRKLDTKIKRWDKLVGDLGEKLREAEEIAMDVMGGL